MPPLFDLEKNPPQGREEWARFLRTFTDKMTGIHGGFRPDPPNAAIAALIISQYSQAKKGLAAAGLSSERIAEMSVCEAVSRHFIGDFTRTRDDLFRWMTLPYPKAKPFLEKEEEKLRKHGRAGKGMSVAAILLPAISAARGAEIRPERHANMLMIVHAVREYAASHEGTLPETLDVMKDVIILNDPATGKPFGYRVSDGKAIIELDDPRWSPSPHRYEVRIIKNTAKAPANGEEG